MPTAKGKEGKFYCWTTSELSRLLTPEEYAVATRYFGITQGGNFVDHSDPDPLPGQNVLSIVDADLRPPNRAFLPPPGRNVPGPQPARAPAPGRQGARFLERNDARRAGPRLRVLGDESFRAAAEKNLAFLRRELWDPSSRTLHHRWREGERDSVQLLTAYANLCAGALDLYEATLDGAHLELAVALAEAMLEKFFDADRGGFYDSAAGAAI